MMRTFVVTLVLLGGCGDSTDEPLACTAAGCTDGVHMVVHAERNAWSAGNYTVEVSADKDSYKCTTKLPSMSQSAFDNVKLECDRASASWFLSRREGCEAERDAGIEDDVTCGTLELSIRGTPSSVRVQIDRSGTTVLDESWAPKYKEVAPNGRECGPICKQSSAEWTLSD